jgi:hypothetical protein
MMTEIDQRSSQLLDELLWLAHHIHQRLDHLDDGDYPYALGQRNTYARAAAIIAAPHQQQDSAEIAERIVHALESGGADLARLRTIALDQSIDPVDPSYTHAGLEWLGRAAFDARYGGAPGIDEDFGMRWGPRHDQRISLRRPSDSPAGMLYVYDPTWDQYALLQWRVPASTVRAVFLNALKHDEHLPVEEFARRIEAHRDLRSAPMSIAERVVQP